MSRLLRGYMLTAYENIALWHERDISHSSVERIIIPDAFHITHHMVKRVRSLLENLTVFEDKIQENIYKTDGMIYSQNILTWLISKGLTRIHAYQIVKQAAHMVGREYDMGQAVFQLLPEEIRNHDNLQELNDVMNTDKYLTHIDTIYKRV
jgi:adenylosuccinate lyase